AGSGLADLAHLRLAEGASRCAGRLQVLHEGRWGGVCAHTWDLAAAQVSCRQLGCGPALEASKVSAGGEELTWVEAVRCNGTEGNLLECQVQVWGAPRCPHATVTCAAPGATLAPSGATLTPSGATPAPSGATPTPPGEPQAPPGEASLP
ncbi:C163A protein, partial [Aphelocoma coerulescens]|nr:C163A protein [Aphelocoma coerulescens]